MIELGPSFDVPAFSQPTNLSRKIMRIFQKYRKYNLRMDLIISPYVPFKN